MRMPRLRFRLRTQLAAVAVAAVVLAAYLLVVSASDASARTECAANLRQTGLALLNYSVSHGSFPPGTLPHRTLPPTQRLSWWLLLGSYLWQNIFFIFDPNESWDGGANRVPMLEVGNFDEDPPRTTEPVGDLPLVQCPAHRHRTNPRGACETDHVAMAGLGADAPTLPLSDPRAGVFGYDRQARPADIRDGAATTMLVVETSSANGPWTRGGPSTVRGIDPARRPYIGPGRQFGGTHRGGANVLFADGSVRFLPEAVDPKVFEALATIAGGEPLPRGWDQ